MNVWFVCQSVSGYGRAALSVCEKVFGVWGWLLAAGDVLGAAVNGGLEAAGVVSHTRL